MKDQRDSNCMLEYYVVDENAQGKVTFGSLTMRRCASVFAASVTSAVRKKKKKKKKGKSFSAV